MPRQEQLGARAVLEGVDKFTRDMARMGKSWDDLQRKLTTAKPVSFAEALSGRATDITKPLEQVGAAGEQATGVLGALGGALGPLMSKLTGTAGAAGTLVSALGGPVGLVLGIGAAVFGLVKLKGAADDAMQRLDELAKKALSVGWNLIQAAGRTEELEISAHGLATTMGIAAEDVDKSITSLREYGIRQDVAAKTTAEMIRWNLDLGQSFDVARQAQGAAVIAGKDSSDVLERMIHGVSVLMPRMIRYAGFAVPNLTEAYRRYAEEQGRAVDSLTEMEKRQALFAAVLESNRNIVDLYTLALQSPTKALRTLERKMFDLTAVMGRPFLGPVAKIVQVFDRVVTAIRAAVEEGGVLYPHLIAIAGVVDWVAEALSYLADILIGPVVEGAKSAAGATEELEKGAEQVGTTFIRLVENISDFLFGEGGLGAMVLEMGRYGFYLVAVFATGIVKAAETLLIPALEVIGAILKAFLGPGSPPKIAPLLPEWGMSAMAEFLHGMTQADFSALEKVQGPLQKVLDEVAFAEVSLDLSEMLATGDVDEGFFADLARRVGLFGDEIAELARLEIQLAQATEAVEDAERRAGQARSQQQRLVDQYNQLLREGADKEILDAKLAQINAAEESMYAADADRAAAEANLGTLKAQAQHQEKVVGQLLKMTRNVEGTTRSLGGLTKGLAGVAEGFQAAAGGMTEWTRGLEDAIAEARELFEEKLAYLFEPMMEVFQEEMFPALENIWRGVEENILRPLGLLKDKAAPELAEAVQLTGEELEKLNQDALIPTGAGIRGFTTDAVVPLHDSLVPIRDALGDITTGFEGMGGAIGDIDVAPLRAFTGYSPSPLGDGLRDASGAMGDMVDELKDFAPAMKKAGREAAKATRKLEDLAEDVFEEIVDAVEEVGDEFLEFFNPLRRAFDREGLPAIRRIKDALRGVWDGFTTTWTYYVSPLVSSMVGDFAYTIPSAISGTRTALGLLADTLSGPVGSTFIWFTNNVVTPLVTRFGSLIVATAQLIILVRQLALELRLFPWHLLAIIAAQSPSPLELGIRGAADALGELVGEFQRLSPVLTTTLSPQVAVAPMMAGGAGGARTLIVNLSVGSVGSEGDMQALEDRVRGVIREEFGRG